MAMSLRDNAIVAYAETKVMKKSDRDVWVLGGEILESLLDKTGFEKKEIDALVMSGLTGTGGASRCTPGVARPLAPSRVPRRRSTPACARWRCASSLTLTCASTTAATIATI